MERAFFIAGPSPRNPPPVPLFQSPCTNSLTTFRRLLPATSGGRRQFHLPFIYLSDIYRFNVYKKGERVVLTATTMDFQLTLMHLLDRAATVNARSSITTRRPDGTLHRYLYEDFALRARKLADGLRRIGVRPGDRVGSLMWNHHAHMEAYFGVPASGGVLHTINLRLGDDDLAFIIDQADVRILLVDDVCLPLYERIKDRIPVERVFVFSLAGDTVAGYEAYEGLIGSGDGDAPLHEPAEADPATLCFTGGTTGRPKGVVYSHRALVVHAFAEAMVDGFGYGRRDVVMPLVPMFHVNGWGIPYSASMVGASLVFPGIQPTPSTVLDLCCGEKVSWTAAVPTVWADAFHEMARNPGRWKIDHDLTVLAGGSAPHRSLFVAAREHGINLVQGWGMTESSGVVAACRPNRRVAALPPEQQLDIAVKQGVPVPVAQLRVMRDGIRQPWDGTSQGEIEIRGVAVMERYFERPDAADRWTADGWFRTGDIGTVDAEGYVQVHERSEDLIKSGGEWISALSLENALLAHPSVLKCSVIGVPHPRWGERPLAVVVPRPGIQPRSDDLLQSLTAHFAKWQLPDRIEFVPDLPLTSMGKVSRQELKKMFAA